MTMMTGREALMELLRNEGVEYVFGIPGATEILFLDALEDHPEIKYILGLHEVVSLGMAEGYSRTSGKVGVVNLHTCAGLAAAMPMLLNAYGGGVPLVVTAGQQDTRLLMQEPALTGDLVRMASQFTKWSTEVFYAADIPLAIRRAFRVAVHPPTGPVFVSLPQDVLDQSLDFEYLSGTQSFTRLRPDQEAIDAANPSDTIIVHHGTYDGFEVIERSDISIVGDGGPVVTGWLSAGLPEVFMAGVGDSTDIIIEGIDFDGTGIVGEVESIVYAGSTGRIANLTVRNIQGTIHGWGIMIVRAAEWQETTTVDVSGVTIENSQLGVMVYNAEANLDGCQIRGMAPNGGTGIMAIDNAIVSVENSRISDCWVANSEPGTAGNAIIIGLPEGHEVYGVEQDRLSTVEVMGSTISNNNVGIYVDDDGALTANYNNIAGNDLAGVWKENPPSVDATYNWWGDASGPSGVGPGSGDAVSDNVDYEPWLGTQAEAGRKGDFDNDGDIDILDFANFADAYGSELGDPNYNAIGDFDNDGNIDIFDFANFADVYGT